MIRAVGEAVDAAGEVSDEPATVPVQASERAFTGAVWDIQRETFWYRNTAITRDFVAHTGAVGVLALDENNRVLLIKQYRHPVRARLWEIPAGLLDIAGEPPLVAAQRELAEEADVVASDWAVLVDMATSPGGSNERIRIYLARGLTAAAASFPREAEEADIQTRWVPLDRCIDAVLTRRIHNGPLCCAVLAAAAAQARDWRTLGAADEPWPT